MQDIIRRTRSRARAASATVALLAALAAAGSAQAQAAPFVLDSVSAGVDHACGITPRHVAYCWGSNARGQLGNPSVTTPCLGADQACSAKPVRVESAVPLASISAGHSFTCALSTSGVAYCWGNNVNGQLGIGSQVSTRRPEKVAVEGLTFQSISAGDSHACAVATSGEAYCWGDNEAGKLGTGHVGGGHTVPVPVEGHLLFRAVSAGYFHTCGVTRDGTAYCWGRNDQAALGRAPGAPSAVPVRVSGSTAFHRVQAAGQFDYSCGVDTAGAIWCWGVNCFGQLGLDSLTEQCGSPPMPCATKPAAVRVAGVFREVRVQLTHSCALTTDGAAFCWGDNDNGQLGNGNEGDRSATPAAVVGGGTYRAIAVGRDFTCAVTAAGVPQCWGVNDRGQLGIGTDGSRTTPTPLAQP